MTAELRIGECWEWPGRVGSHGYGALGHRLAHRAMFTAVFGEIDDGLELDHLCRNPLCVNPFHLDPVSHTENVRRGMAGQVNGERKRNQTHCKHGHEFTPTNTAWVKAEVRLYRVCIACRRAATRRYEERRKAS